MPTRDENIPEPTDEGSLLRMTTDIVAAYARHNTLAAATLPELIRTVHAALAGLAAQKSALPTPEERPKPAAPIAKSIQHDYLVCLEDGKKLKMLKRYLRTAYGMTPDDYRKRWGLPPDYPMVAPAYAARRSEFAKKIGLGKGARRKD